MSEDETLIFDLPYPPSVNRIWRASTRETKKVHLAPSYKAWRDAAGAMMMTQGGWRDRRLTGPFSADIALCPAKGQLRGDLDNRIKAILDFMQSLLVVANDRNCQRVCAYWVDRADAPEGCRVSLSPWPPQTVNDVLHTTLNRLEA